MRASENFPVASLLVRRSARPLIGAFYAFARQADDIADDPYLGAEDKRARLARFERGLDGDADGEPAGIDLHHALAASGRSAAREHARALLGAFRQDVETRRYRTWQELDAYCRMSANPVGRFVIDIHDEAQDCHPPADALCTALQVLNHLQDVRADYLRLGRIYLPLDWIEAAGGSADDLAGDTASPALRQAMDRALAEAGVLLDCAAALPGRLGSRRLAAEVRMILWLACRLHGRLGREDPLARRVAPTRLDFARGALAGMTGGLTSAGPKGRDAPARTSA